MEILVAVIAFAGALLAVIAAVALGRRLRDDPEGWLIAWTVAVASLAVSLAMVAVGHLLGFGSVTFKLYQLTGSFLAPLWLSIGLIQLLAEKVPPKFAAWLFGIAFTIVVGVILLVDPVRKSDEMTKALPTAAGHWGLIPDKLLLGAHVIIALILLGALVVGALRWRNGDDYDTDNLHATIVIVPSGLALLGAMRFAVPGLFAVALLVVAAAAIWYSVLRPLAPYEDEDEDDDEVPSRRGERAQGAGHRAAAPVSQPRPDPVVANEMPPAVQPRRSSGLGDLVAEYRAGDREIDYAARMAPPPESGPSTGYIMNGRHGAPEYGMPATGAVYPGADMFATGAYSAQPQVPQSPQPPQSHPHLQAQSQAQPQPVSSKPSPSIYGMLTVFSLIDGSGEAFDRLAEQTVEAVRRGEPDTLIYACHAVKSAPLQRIVYELYRDEVAYRDHQRQPHVERFVNDRQALVLATNIIELNVNAAKVVPLPTAMF
ncbi:putative quinol monooxygenase [Nonomuraea cavernae]|uniref:putative quinol monooxygenase n=1 Tax=Nonomuraea cavernae TaxID=2045107 RepID=UPI0033FA8EF5